MLLAHFCQVSYNETELERSSEIFYCSISFGAPRCSSNIDVFGKQNRCPDKSTTLLNPNLVIQHPIDIASLYVVCIGSSLPLLPLKGLQQPKLRGVSIAAFEVGLFGRRMISAITDDLRKDGVGFKPYLLSSSPDRDFSTTLRL